MKKSINLPNIISFCRIILSLVLLLLMNSITLFVILYLIIGLSDIADGYIARKYNMVTPAGARLDSIADFVFYMVLLIMLFLQYKWVVSENILLFVTVLIVRLSSITVSKIKFGRVVFIHTIANKITGLLVFVSIPLLVAFQITGYVLIAVLTVAILSAVEELCIVVKNKKIDLNQKSIFCEIKI